MQKITKRRFLQGAAATVFSPVPATVPFIETAEADFGVTAVVIAALSLASSIASLLGGSGGIGDMLASIQMSINAVLEIQKKTLEAIQLQ